MGKHTDFDNFVLCNGFSGHGLQHSPAAGRAIAELIVYGEYRSINLDKFSFDRVLKSEPIHETGIV